MTARTLLQELSRRGWRLTTAESCTGGMIAAAVTDLPGASAVFDRGFVTYSNAAKIDMLGVDAGLISDHGAVSTHVAQAMAVGALARSQADIAVSVTGIAGPGGSEFKPEGRVCFGWATRDEPVISETVDFGPLGRDKVRAATVDHALSRLVALCQG